MKYSDKTMILTFYCTFIGCAFIEISFLFEIPYYHFSVYLQCLKILRIILGIINVLINLYFRVVQYAEYLIKEEEQAKESIPLLSNRYNLSDKILIIIGFIISFITFCLNFTGIILTKNYLKKKDSSSLQSSLYIDSLLFLIENIIISLCWIFFTIYWGLNIKKFIKSQKRSNQIQDNANKSPPPRASQQQASSERQFKELINNNK